MLIMSTRRCGLDLTSKSTIISMKLARFYKLCSCRIRILSHRWMAVVGFGGKRAKLPYDDTNPIIYDKDEVVNCYTDDYLMSLASAGDIKLVGIITSSTVQDYNKHVTLQDYERMVTQRREGIRHARNSGFRNIPDPVRGPKAHLVKPASGRIEDTRPTGSPGSRLIMDEARKATVEKPLVVVVGGALTAAADAYLLDNAIADHVIVAWLGGRENDMCDYNGWADAWAAYIVLQKLRLVQFPAWQAVPRVPKPRLAELPDTELRQWMIEKRHSLWRTHDGELQPGRYDGDASPAISVMRQDYVIKTKTVSFSHWADNDHELPVFRDDPGGRALVVACACAKVATEEWWRALKNPAAYGAVSLS